MKKLLLLLATAIFITSCGDGKRTGNSEERIINKLLAENNIFVTDSVKLCMGKANKDQVTKAKVLFFQGLDLLVNKQISADGIKHFRESIMYNPTAKAYYYLANAYIDLPDTSKGKRALWIASSLGYEEEDQLAYTGARLSALDGDTLFALNQLKDAFELGFVNKQRIETDKCFDKMRSLREFEAMMVENFKDEVALKAKLFKGFLAEFPQTNFPLEISKDSIVKAHGGNFINYDFAPFIIGMEDKRFSRDVTNEYFSVSGFKTPENIFAAVYKTVAATADTLPSSQIKIATYDSTGKILSELIFCEFTLPTTLKTGSIDENQIITVKEFKIKWKNAPIETSYVDNKWLSEDLLSENKYKIDSSGQFILYTENNTKVAKP